MLDIDGNICNWSISVKVHGIPFFDPTEPALARHTAPNATRTARNGKARPRGMRARRAARRRGGGKGSDEGEPSAGFATARATRGSP